MKIKTAIFVLALALAMVLPAASFAADKYPTEGSFHVDVRVLTLIGFDIETIFPDTDEDNDPFTVNTTIFGGVPNYGMGIKLGYLIGGNHDVGAHFMFTGSSVVSVYDPDEDGVDETTTTTTYMDFQLAPYYNYNFHVSDWLMPYVGPLVGIGFGVVTMEDDDNDDLYGTTTTVKFFGGLEGGIKLFPFEHVAFDIGANLLGGTEAITYAPNDSDEDDLDSAGTFVGFGIFGGMNIYF